MKTINSDLGISFMLLTGIWFVLQPGTLLAFGGFEKMEPTVLELKALPPYCTNRAKNSPQMKTAASQAEIKRWTAILGDDFRHIHHYCKGLLQVHRIPSAINNPRQLRYLRKTAISNFDYVQRNAEPGYVLSPEVAVKKGKVLVSMGRESEAIAEYYKSIKFKPNYATAYAALFDLYIDMGLIDDAEKALRSGLARKPKSQRLLRRRARLSRAKQGQ